jgi:ADP-ribosylglycohydrolase
MAIGDAFGMPVAGWSATTIADWYDTITDYLPRKFPDGDEVGPGEITDDTEIALCIIESVTAGQGQIDVENIGIRMSYLTRSDSRRWMTDETATALQDRSEQHQFQLPLVDDECVHPDVLARGIPIGLMHSMGAPDEAAIRSDVSAVTRITHGSPLAMSAVEAVARAVAMAARHELALDQLRAEVANQLPDGAVREALGRHGADLSESHEVVETLMSALRVVETATAFEDVLERAVAPGGATDTRAALAAAIYGAHHGSGVIPQRLIDGLESRIFVSLAAPWFYRTIARLRGRAIDFRPGIG